ncbi:Uncharacterized protein FKW44_007707, partial [Caligus rogercresseyi]
ANKVAEYYKKAIGLPSSWDRMIRHSLLKLYDGRHFTSQFLISANLLRFFSPCKNCGKLYNDTLHAFVD